MSARVDSVRAMLTNHRWRLASTAILALLLPLLVSAPAQAAPKPRVTIKASATTVQVGALVSVTATVKRGAARQRIVLQAKNGRRWTQVDAKRLPKKGAAKRVTFLTRAATAKTVVVRAVLLKKGRVKGATSRPISITAVRPAPVPGANPASPLRAGQTFTSGTWALTFGATDQDAWPEIAAAEPFATPPAPGWSIVMVPVTMTRLSGAPTRPWLDIDLRFLGGDQIAYSYSEGENDCYLIPDDAWDIGDMYPTATATGNFCAVVPTSAVAAGRWRVATDWSDSYRYIALN